jgi:hypothetical protein
MNLKHPRQILLTLLAAAALGLLAAGGVLSCGRGGGDAAAVDTGPAADTVALTEGLRLYGEGEYELAREQLMRSAGSKSTYIRAESFLYLNALEMDLGNWDEARGWLERYHAEAVKLFRQTVDVEERITIHREETERSIASLRWLVAGIVCVVVSMAALALREHGRRTAGKEPAAPSAAPDGMEQAEWGKYLEGAGAFMQTPIYAGITELERQTPDRRARVLPLSRQEALDAALAEHFSGFAEQLRAACPALTAGDVKLCCLSLVPLSTFGRALCFGSTETNIIKQRKHKIKQKLTADEAGRQLFGFIFAQRGQIPHL